MISKTSETLIEDRVTPGPGRRLIGTRRFGREGPTVVCFGGIHGNEPAGELALEAVFAAMKGREYPGASGTFIGIRGNLQALSHSRRFLKYDLNRLWSRERLERIDAKAPAAREAEERELCEIRRLLNWILRKEKPPFYFIDLHTTSSPTLPFLTINDAVINRKFSSLFPVPVILGIEEYLEGPLLSHINELGYVSLGFESGQHEDRQAVENAIDFLWNTLGFSGVLPEASLPEGKEHLVRLREAAKGDHHFYEVFYRHALEVSETFRMVPGYRSFQPLPKGTLLAHDRGIPIYMKKKGILFMPLYQKQGEEGFFLIRKIPSWALRLSAWLRKWNMQNTLAWLPGVKWEPGYRQRLLVNLRIAKFFSKPFFHLLGYRSKQKNRNQLILSNRERAARNEDYEDTFWFKRTRPEP